MIENPHTNRTGIMLITGVVVAILICVILVVLRYKNLKVVPITNDAVVTSEMALENETEKSVDNIEDAEYTGKYQKSGKLEKIMKQIAEKTETTAVETE